MGRHLQGKRGVVNRTRLECVRDLVAAWRTEEMAATCRAGHLHNHLTNALDGSQDELGGGEAHAQWARVGMAEVRAETMRRVD
eukprot:3965193-Alexandrium_andersonii.AAC.1